MNKTYKRVAVEKNDTSSGSCYSHTFVIYVYTPAKEWVAEFRDYRLAQKFAATLRKK